MTPTTLLGNIGKWSGLLSGLGLLIAPQLPNSKGTTYLITAVGALTAVAHWANGEGNRQSQTGGPQA